MLTTKALLPQAEPRGALREPPARLTAAPAPVALPPRESSQDRSEVQNPFRKIALYAALGLLFLRLTAISELLLSYTGNKFYLLYLFAPLAILGALVTGGVGRTLRSKAAWYWIAYFGWMILATLFSTWRGDSTRLVLLDYGRVEIPMLFVIGGLAMQWKEIRMIFHTVAFAAVVSLAESHWSGKLDMGGRISMGSVSTNLGNSNDLGAHLLLVMPFLLFVMLDRTRAVFLRMFLLPVIAYGIWTVVGTGSRGCLIALAAMLIFALWRGSSGQRAAILVAACVLGVVIPLLLPASILTRLGSLFSDQSETGATQMSRVEAQESSAQRAYLLKQSLLYTAQHPLFGVGPGQFPNYEGKERKEEGKRGAWNVTHNFLTQVSSESGIPAVIFVLLGLGSAAALVNRTYQQACKKGFRDIANACYCYQLGLVGYLGSIIFLAHAYHFYLPTMIGLAISMSLVAAREMSARQPRSVAEAAPRSFAIR